MVQPRTCLFSGHFDTSSSWSAWTPDWTATIWRELEEVPSESDRDAAFLSKYPMLRAKSDGIATKKVLLPLRNRIDSVILSRELAVHILNVDAGFEESFVSLRGKTVSAAFVHDSVCPTLAVTDWGVNSRTFMKTCRGDRCRVRRYVGTGA